MDLGNWTSDLDTSLLNCWNDTTETSAIAGSDPKEKKHSGSKSYSSRSSPRDGSTGWDVNHWASLSAFSVDYETAPSEKSKCSDVERKTSQEFDSSMQHGSMELGPRGSAAHSASRSDAAISAPPAPVSDTTSVTSRRTNGTSSVAGFSDSSSEAPQTTAPAASTLPPNNFVGGTNNSQNTPQLHPLAIQSSATCPAHSSSTAIKPTPHPFEQMQMPTQGIIPQQQPQHAPHNLYPIHGLDEARVASLALSLRQGSHPGVSVATGNANLDSLAANFLLAQAGSSIAAAAGTAQVPSLPQHSHVPQHALGMTHSQPRHNTVSQPQTDRSVAHSVTATSSSSGKSTSSLSSSSQPSHARPQQQQQQTPKPPPFYLFDAPVELRANFMQNQRKLGIPIHQDCNSYHYGETVKGFHPQHLLNAQPGHVGQPPSAPVQLIDARHGNGRLQVSGRVKNEREQKRAQKITELIEQLRINMENGGWKVEMRSKFHTLSSCAQYVKHMMKKMKDKEVAVNRLKAELEVKQRKIEEDRAVQDSRSDPESVTSSLTSSTGSSSGLDNRMAENDKKRKAESSEESSGNKKHRLGSRPVSSDSTSEDSSEERVSRGSVGQESFEIDKSVSDITDSNRGSSSNTSGSGSDVPTEQTSRVSAEEDRPVSGSVSSEAAVANEKSSGDCHSGEHTHNHKDVVFKTEKRSDRKKDAFKKEKRSDRKRRPEEVNSLERSFELDYEEVFDESNIPQLIAATSGKIISYNECFIKATGLRKSEMERMTIFSLVKPDKLSNFFEIVATALRPPVEETDTGSEETAKYNKPSTDEDSTEMRQSSEERLSDSSKERQWNYTAMTLPCVEFPAMKKRRAASKRPHRSDPLNVTVTLMTDKDPRMRCFHCVFSNCPGTNGTLGSITPELLSSLFAAPESKKKHKHKRARTHKSLPSQPKKAGVNREPAEESNQQQEPEKEAKEGTKRQEETKEAASQETKEQKEIGKAEIKGNADQASED